MSPLLLLIYHFKDFVDEPEQFYLQFAILNLEHELQHFEVNLMHALCLRLFDSLSFFKLSAIR